MLANPWFTLDRVQTEIGGRPLAHASFGSEAVIPRKFYHRACVGCGYRAARARRGRSWSESSGQSPVSEITPLAAPGIPQRDCARPLVALSPARQRWGR